MDTKSGSDNPPIIWEGRELRTMGETMRAVLKIAQSGDRARAAAFMEAYEKITTPDIVRKNIGYASGYYDVETAAKILDVFDTRHPLFGRSRPSHEWAFEIGRRRARGGQP